MSQSMLNCPKCNRTMVYDRAKCGSCDTVIEGIFDLGPLAHLSLEDQDFVISFLRCKGSNRAMQKELSISYPTVKRMLKSVVKRIDDQFILPSSKMEVLDQIEKGDITVSKALEMLERLK